MDSKTDAVKREIERYVLLHPDAVDTVAGIACSWLETAVPDRDARTVGLALQQLVARGALRVRVLPDGSEVYSAAAMNSPGAGSG